MKQSVVNLHPPGSSPALYKEWIVYFVPLRSLIGATFVGFYEANLTQMGHTLFLLQRSKGNNPLF
jgi:hypothetical protein